MEKGEHSFKTFTHQRTVCVHIFCPIFQKTPLKDIFTPKQWCALVPPGKVFVWIFCAAPPPSSPHSLLQSHSSLPTSNSVATSTWKQLNSTAINVSTHMCLILCFYHATNYCLLPYYFDDVFKYIFASLPLSFTNTFSWSTKHHLWCYNKIEVFWAHQGKGMQQ